MNFSLFRKVFGLTLVELIVAMVLINLVVLGIVKTLHVSSQMVTFASNDTMAISLAQEALEKIRYERDKYTRNNAADEWHAFLSNFLLRDTEQNIEDICDENKKYRFINSVISEEQSEEIQAILVPQNYGKLVSFEGEEDREKIVLFSEEENSSIVFYRQLQCRLIGSSYERDDSDIIEFIVQIDWEHKGIPRALPMKIDLARQI